MNVVDSCAWLEYFADGANAAFFARAIENTGKLFVPTLALYEVFKRVMQQRTESDALQAVAVMQQGTVVALDARIALSAAHISIVHKLPMADSVMLATARVFGATLWTQDDDFKGLSGVQYRPAKKRESQGRRAQRMIRAGRAELLLTSILSSERRGRKNAPLP